MLRKITLGLVLLVVLVLNSFRCWKLDSVPNGYHVDELGSAVTVQCFAENGCDADLRHWPLFGLMQFGQDKPPTYVYPGMLWAKIFGSTVPSLRGLSVGIFFLGIAGLFLLARQFLGKSFAAVIVLAASCSPWAWVVSRLALESFFAPVFVIWGLYFFWRSSSWWDWALAGLFFASAMYAYPPARLQIPLMIITLGFFEWGRRSISWPSFFSFGFVFIMSLIPMLALYTQGGLTRRFDQIGIFNQDFLYVSGRAGTWWDLTGVFINNYLLHLTPNFLFFKGDHSYLYSTRHLGIFSWLDITALIICIVFVIQAFLRCSWDKNPVIVHRRWLVLIGANILIGIIPSALTNQELPHALRICGSWPFMMLFTGLMWCSAAECLVLIWPGVVLIGGLYTGVLLHQYFVIYPEESKEMFGFKAKEIAEQLRTPEDWRQFLLVFHPQQYHCRYFLAHRLGLNCQQAKDAWQQTANSKKLLDHSG